MFQLRLLLSFILCDQFMLSFLTCFVFPLFFNDICVDEGDEIEPSHK